jgi:hypothetical protein
MNEANFLAITLVIGVTAGAFAWEWMRGDLLPRLWYKRNAEREARVLELLERVGRLEHQLSIA